MCLGIPGQIVQIVESVDATSLLASVDVGGVRREVNIAFIVDQDHPVNACVGDWVLVHVGFALARIDENEAAATLALLREIGEYQSEIDSMQASAAGNPA